jgi:hypothetical protein
MATDPFKKNLWISGGIVVGSLLIALGALIFLADNLNSQVAMIAEARSAVQKQTDQVAELASLEQQSARAVQYQSAINQLLPDQYGIFNFPEWFLQVGHQYNVTSDASLQGTVTPSKGSAPGTAMFSFDAQGSMSDITSFLDAAVTKSSGFLFTITSFTLTSDGTEYKITGQGTLFSR